MTTPTPTEAAPPNPGGDMTDGVARAHLETPEEIAATPTDIEVDTNRQVITAPVPNTATVENALLEDIATGDLTSPLPEPITLANAYKFQHAKVLRFEISVGKDDDDTTLEEYEAAVREALAFARDHSASVFTNPTTGLKFHNLTTQGSYYIIDGKVCLPSDYDPASKNRKPGTYPPSWAGGPNPGEKPPYEPPARSAAVAPTPRPSQSSRITQRLTEAKERDEPKVQGTPESVRALAESINLKIKGKRGS